MYGSIEEDNSSNTSLFLRLTLMKLLEVIFLGSPLVARQLRKLMSGTKTLYFKSKIVEMGNDRCG